MTKAFLFNIPICIFYKEVKGRKKVKTDIKNKIECWLKAWTVDEVPDSIPSRINLETSFSKLVLAWVYRAVPQSEYRCSSTQSTGNSLV